MINSKKIFLISFFCLFSLIFYLFFGASQENVLPAYADDSATTTAAFHLFATATTSVKIFTVCGNGYIDPDEVCDPGNALKNIPPGTGAFTCQDFIDPYSGTPFNKGRLACATDCSNYDTSTCSVCGDSHKQLLEECDGTDFGGAVDCTGYGYTTGSIRCTPNCRIDLSDCSVIGVQLPIPGSTANTGGGGGGSSGATTGFSPGTKTAPVLTQVAINGIGYPNREVRVLIDGTVVGIVQADSKGDFQFESGDTTAGVSSFGLWTDDVTGLKSTLLTLTFRVASQSITTIQNVYLSPTIDVDKTQVNKGDNIKIFGASSPSINIAVHVNSEVERVATTTSNDAGGWSLTFNTSPLEEDFHTVKALIHLNSPSGIIESEFSRSVSFYVGKNVPVKGKCGIGDLNCDNAVNLVDFSILLYNWGTSDATADVNKDGNVGLADFSIMMYYWTG
jgi:hypothetical protein